MSIDDIAKGLLTGFLVAIILLYSFRPKTPYPKWMLLSYEHPWIFVILGIIDAYLFVWDRVSGVLGFIVIACLIIDFHVLSKKPIMGANDYMFNTRSSAVSIPEQHEQDHQSFGPSLATVSLEDDIYPVFDNHTSDQLQPGNLSPF